MSDPPPLDYLPPGHFPQDVPIPELDASHHSLSTPVPLPVTRDDFKHSDRFSRKRGHFSNSTAQKTSRGGIGACLQDYLAGIDKNQQRLLPRFSKFEEDRQNDMSSPENMIGYLADEIYNLERQVGRIEANLKANIAVHSSTYASQFAILEKLSKLAKIFSERDQVQSDISKGTSRLETSAFESGQLLQQLNGRAKSFAESFKETKASYLETSAKIHDVQEAFQTFDSGITQAEGFLGALLEAIEYLDISVDEKYSNLGNLQSGYFHELLKCIQDQHSARAFAQRSISSHISTSDQPARALGGGPYEQIKKPEIDNDIAFGPFFPRNRSLSGGFLFQPGLFRNFPAPTLSGTASLSGRCHTAAPPMEIYTRPASAEGWEWVSISNSSPKHSLSRSNAQEADRPDFSPTFDNILQRLRIEAKDEASRLISADLDPSSMPKKADSDWQQFFGFWEDLSSGGILTFHSQPSHHTSEDHVSSFSASPDSASNNPCPEASHLASQTVPPSSLASTTFGSSATLAPTAYPRKVELTEDPVSSATAVSTIKATSQHAVPSTKPDPPSTSPKDRTRLFKFEEPFEPTPFPRNGSTLSWQRHIRHRHTESAPQLFGISPKMPELETKPKDTICGGSLGSSPPAGGHFKDLLDSQWPPLPPQPKTSHLSLTLFDTSKQSLNKTSKDTASSRKAKKAHRTRQTARWTNGPRVMSERSNSEGTSFKPSLSPHSTDPTLAGIPTDYCPKSWSPPMRTRPQFQAEETPKANETSPTSTASMNVPVVLKIPKESPKSFKLGTEPKTLFDTGPPSAITSTSSGNIHAEAPSPTPEPSAPEEPGNPVGNPIGASCL
ncbi:hypothetical protein G7Y89_g2889 [Cudoniella acicularis]|uniref:Uncharacterized protein n=1 Tax=Cudoniella acicularis TaxID=354080 RepID=A0A8H4RSG1_9HELO|nr:hypothetical protein G7Y89_g2889 [Cudoniella acicularis]